VTPIDLGHHGDSEVQPGLVDFAVNVDVLGGGRTGRAARMSGCLGAGHEWRG
jgi:hypothetical protein